MSTDDPVSDWIEGLKAGEEGAAAKLWAHFYSQLVALACRKLREAPRRAADEEDVVLSAFETFFRRAQEGRFPQLHDRNDLWRLLVRITERKAFNQARDLRRQKRGGGMVRGDSAFLGETAAASGDGIDQIPGLEPTPECAAAVAEEFGRLMSLLDDGLRRIAVLKLDGHTNEEIATLVDRSAPTVERRLRLIRDIWRGETA